MNKQDEPTENKDIKTDLKHDTMEFSAATDEGDKLDLDNNLLEDDGISGEELDYLTEDDAEMGAALNAVETDRLTDVDNLPEESDEDDYYDNDPLPEGESDERN